jgi:pantoate--beta-alanine ligase
MKVFSSKTELKKALSTLAVGGKSVALVPTMGALHNGHLALVYMAREKADIVVCSIFVNPTQFNNSNDLKKYPRTIADDLQKLESVRCDFVFVPSVDEIYPYGPISQKYDLGVLDKVMEGEFRPGHFDGVATVVSRLFDLVEPNIAIFGDKDFQQVAVIKRMVELDQHKVEIIASPIIREESGLAMSSRNTRLSVERRNMADCIYQALHWVKNCWKEFTPEALSQELINRINSNAGFEVEYAVFCDAESLEPVSNWEDAKHVQLCVVVYCEEVRLLDNLSIF